jgi:AcrR family transcriptional regulator
MLIDTTREQIIDVADRLFGEGGEGATSLRAITRAAGVNVAAIHYHFGGRDGLLEAVLDRYIGPLNARRLDLLEALDPSASLEAIVDAFIRPDFELIARLRSEGRGSLVSVLGAAYSQPTPLVAALLERQFAPIAEAFLPEFARRLPDLPAAELRARVELVVRLITSVFAADRLQTRPPAIEEQVRRVVSFVAGGLSAVTR